MGASHLPPPRLFQSRPEIHRERLGDELLAALRVRFPDRSEADCQAALSASGGWFWFETVEEGALTVSFADGVLTVSGRHDAEGERFAFRILLRPWGADWTDTDETPYSYRFWYRPLIEAGEAMPDRIQQVLER